MIIRSGAVRMPHRSHCQAIFCKATKNGGRPSQAAWPQKDRLQGLVEITPD